MTKLKTTNGKQRLSGRQYEQLYASRVTDSKTSKQIFVTADDCTNAICRDHQKCAIAKAIKRSTKAEWVDVGAKVVIIGNHKKAKRYILPEATREQVRYFDQNGAFAPCKVVLRAPHGNRRLGYDSLQHRPRKSGPHHKHKLRRLPTR